MKILKELLNNTERDEEFPLMESLYAAVDSLVEEDGRIDERHRNHANARFKKFFNSNKELVKDASVVAVSDFAKYNKNTRKTITLHAKDAFERRTIDSIVDALVHSKKFKIHKMKFHGSKKIWIMKKV